MPLRAFRRVAAAPCRPIPRAVVLRTATPAAILLALLCALVGCTRDAGLDPGARLLFADGSGSLSADDRNAIFAELPLEVDPNDPQALRDVSCAQPVEVNLRIEDLNGDGVPEVIVELWSCHYGGTGVGTTLFIRDAQGGYRPNLGFPGVIGEFRPGGRDGYPELVISGMGFCEAVWGWDGGAYDWIRNEPTAPGGCGQLF
jgi:hypothetical protein